MPRYYEDDDEDHIDMRPLLRIGIWGTCAVVAVGATIFAGRTDIGAARAKVALETLRTAPAVLIAGPTRSLAARQEQDEQRARELAEEVRTLTADRDRLADRVATLEHSLSDLTGSLAQQRESGSNGAAASGPAPTRTDDKSETAPPGTIMVPATTTESAGGNEETRVAAAAANQPGVGLPANVPLPRPGPLATIESYVRSTTAAPTASATQLASAATETAAVPAGAPNGYAVDLGQATNVNTLRAHWNAVKTQHGGLVAGLQPLVSVRQSTRPGFTDFHLIAGPVPDSDAAARLCAALASAKVACRPAAFDGQRLEMR